MTEQEYRAQAWDLRICGDFSWRGLLCKRRGLYNYNLSSGGSSNQRQLRLARNFFNSDTYQQLNKEHDKLVVLWGVTSTARNELWSCQLNDYHNFQYTDTNDNFSKFMLKNCYDHDAEVADLRNHMLHWNSWFRLNGIDNFWFDTFNSHNYCNDFRAHSTDRTFEKNLWTHHKIPKDAYDAISGPDWPDHAFFISDDFWKLSSQTDPIIIEIYQRFKLDERVILPRLTHATNQDRHLPPIPNLLDHDLFPRDLLSWLMKQNDIPTDTHQQEYHYSEWMIDRQGIDKLVDLGILNPISFHPTTKAHELLSDYFDTKLSTLFD